MSLREVVNLIEESVSNAYASAGDKGATMPEQKNIKNLAETIASIQGGGGGASALESKFAEVPMPEETSSSSNFAYFSTSDKEHFLSFHATTNNVYVYNRETGMFEIAYNGGTPLKAFFEDNDGNVFCCSKSSSIQGIFKFNRLTRIFEKISENGYYTTTTGTPFKQTSKGVFAIGGGFSGAMFYEKELNSFKVAVSGFVVNTLIDAKNTGLFGGGANGSYGVVKWNEETKMFERTNGVSGNQMTFAFVVNDEEVYFTSQSANVGMYKWKPDTEEFVKISGDATPHYRISYWIVDENNTLYYSAAGTMYAAGLWACKYGEYVATQLVETGDSYPHSYSYYFETPNYMLISSSNSSINGIFAINKTTLQKTDLTTSYKLLGYKNGYISSQNEIMFKLQQSPYLALFNEESVSLTIPTTPSNSSLNFTDSGYSGNPNTIEDSEGNIIAGPPSYALLYDRDSKSFAQLYANGKDRLILDDEIYAINSASSNQCLKFNKQTKVFDALYTIYYGAFDKMQVRGGSIYYLTSDTVYEFVLDKENLKVVRTNNFNSSLEFGDVKLTHNTYLISNGGENVAVLKSGCYFNSGTDLMKIPTRNKYAYVLLAL